jgi:site-specific recombinase XerC
VGGHIAGNTDVPRFPDPSWLPDFQTSLERADLAPATVHGYLKDIRQFLRWRAAVPDDGFPALTELELIAWRQHMIAQRGLRPATVNRRLEALRRLCRWAQATGRLPADIVGSVRPVRTERGRQPA